nr:proteolytic subunit 2 of clp protease [Dictyochloris fragrans]
MPIGVPRIIYCWGEELPAQWTDIYNFIFRRRMVFLMQYLDDELCNQICGLLINIHMEDRSKELEKKEMENSGLFKGPNKQKKSGLDTSSLSPQNSILNASGVNFSKQKSIEDLMSSEQDLGIDENYTLERYTLQKMTLEWLNWNAQFFDYSEEPYLFYLAEILSKDFQRNDGRLSYDNNEKEMSKLMMMFKNMTNSKNQFDPKFFDINPESNKHFDVYSPFRLLSNFVSHDYDNVNLSSNAKTNLANKLQLLQKEQSGSFATKGDFNKASISELLGDSVQKDLLSKLQNQQTQLSSSEKALTQRQLRREYSTEQFKTNYSKNQRIKPASYLDLNASDNQALNNQIQYRDYYRKQTERALQDEESKKVFVIINSFGGSVGNGITVHDALQFIKAGSLTLALGVAASAASLALAGGTIGERYVTEGCHVMIHQPEGGLTGQASDIWIDSQEIMKIRLDVAEIYSLSTYRPRHKILRDLDRDFYLTATETIFYGLADEIATNDVMHEIIEMTSKVWDYHDSQQQRLLESRTNSGSGMDTQTQN